MTLTAVGTDAEQVGASVEMINQLIAQGKEELKQAADTPMGAMVKPYQAMLDSLKVAHDGGTMTMTGEMSATAPATSSLR
jgi:ketosteroid isomerase-like protein